MRYYYLPLDISKGQGILDWLRSILPETAKIDARGLEADSLQAAEPYGLYTFGITLEGARRHWLTFFTASTGFPTDDRPLIRIRMDDNTALKPLLEQLVETLDGWCAPDSKDFVRPKTGERMFLYLVGEQTLRHLTRYEAIMEITHANPELCRNALAAGDLETLARTYTSAVRVQACVEDDGLVVPDATKIRAGRR